MFGGPLSAGDLVALRAVGWSPLGQVFGTATFQLLPSPANAWPPGTGRWQGELACQRTALQRLTGEAISRHAGGVLGVRMRATRQRDGLLYECWFEGVAVERAESDASAEPFLAHFSAVEFRSLANAGFRPVSVVLELLQRSAMVALNPMPQLSAELAGASALVRGTVGQVRRRSAEQARAAGASGIVVKTLDVSGHREYGSPGSRKIRMFCEVSMWGTSIVATRTDRNGDRPAGILGIGARR